MKQSGDYLKLFLLREGKVVLGRYYSNIWLLTAVLTATFFAIAFSNGSLTFLSEKMRDPFINWVDLKNEGQNKEFRELEAALYDDELQERYHYQGIETGYQFGYPFYDKTMDDVHIYLRGRYFSQMNSPLIEAILSPDNVVGGWAVPSVADIPETTIGIIITSKALGRLGYDEAPAYIDYYAESSGAEEKGITVYNGYARAPIPVLGVVKRLPGNVDIISSTRFYKHSYANSILPFNLNKEQYGHSLQYFVPVDVDKDAFISDMKAALLAHTDVPFNISDEDDPTAQYSFKDHVIRNGEDFHASYISIFVPDTLQVAYEDIRGAHNEIMAKYAVRDVHRYYPYEFNDNGRDDETGAYLSVHFRDLNEIKAFQNFVNGYGIEIEMTQINAKENFNSVSLLAGVLSWAMIAFAIICILLFLINLLQSYFQKVKKNIGTFKAFGISNGELISVYMIIMSILVILSIVIAFCMVYAFQCILPGLGIVKDGCYNYLSLLCSQAGYSILIIVVSSLLTVLLLMKRMLKSSPGDLIYDR